MGRQADCVPNSRVSARWPAASLDRLGWPPRGRSRRVATRPSSAGGGAVSPVVHGPGYRPVDRPVYWAR
ncbi:hypothetical protein GLA29479_4529 [Lysobacter antibioticus]|nr:hypothetical protein GLA29479_4529 [Lysobacter antibioticus]